MVLFHVHQLHQFQFRQETTPEEPEALLDDTPDSNYEVLAPGRSQGGETSWCRKKMVGRGVLYIVWLVVWNMNFMTFHILGISSSQLTFIFFQRG